MSSEKTPTPMTPATLNWLITISRAPIMKSKVPPASTSKLIREGMVSVLRMSVLKPRTGAVAPKADYLQITPEGRDAIERSKA